ncbi:YppG family protein [Salipaludibacillus sp. HK11]|uniref:YppG family protein n=1 Tax=Salipaludibacillus sp. HK11 TaxID=3394320 RepID=UPI0039FDD708
MFFQQPNNHHPFPNAYHQQSYYPPEPPPQYWSGPQPGPGPYYQQPPYHGYAPPQHPGPYSQFGQQVPQQKPPSKFMNAFQSADGKFDFQKTMTTMDQVVKTASHVSPLVKQVGGFFIKKP